MVACSFETLTQWHSITSRKTCSFMVIQWSVLHFKHMLNVSGISGEKVEIDPVIQQKVSAKFWNRQKAVSYDMDTIAACDLTDTKSSSRSTFRLVYHHSSGGSEQAESLQHHTDLTSYKHHDFEADHRTAEEIVQKINHILELRSSVRRREYLALRERKSHRKRSFHLGPRWLLENILRHLALMCLWDSTCA